MLHTVVIEECQQYDVQPSLQTISIQIELKTILFPPTWKHRKLV